MTRRRRSGRRSASRRTQEQIVVEEVISTVGEEGFVAVRQHGWLPRECAGDSTGGRREFFFF